MLPVETVAVVVGSLLVQTLLQPNQTRNLMYCLDLSAQIPALFGHGGSGFGLALEPFDSFNRTTVVGKRYWPRRRRVGGDHMLGAVAIKRML